MSKNSKVSVPDDLYTRHLYGTKFANNPGTNRKTVIERMYQRILTELATNRFKWTGMPEEIDVRFVEQTLFYQALSVFFWNTDFEKYMSLRGGAQGYLNYQNNPTGFVVVGNNFVSKTLSAKECVPIWSNYMRVPDHDIVSIYSTKLAEIDRTLEINSRNARRNKIVSASQDTKLSMQNMNRQLDEGQEVLFWQGQIPDGSLIQALDLGINPDSLEKLHILRTRLWNECMGLLGIENANQDKKERLVASEVDANNDQTSMMRYVNLNARRQAAEQINRMYGLNISVEYHTEIDREVAEQVQPNLEEGDE